MSQTTNLQNLATRVATEAKALRTLINGNANDLSGLTTSAKASLVLAINELQSEINAISGGTEINDGSTGTATTWSSQKISDQLAAGLNALAAGAPTLLDTLDEIAAAIGDDANFATTMTTALGNRVRVDTATQGLTSTQKSNARANIDAVSTTEVGDTTTDFVAVFNAGLV